MTPKRKAINALRHVAAMHFNRKMPRWTKVSGLCWATSHVCGECGDLQPYDDDQYQIINQWCKPHARTGNNDFHQDYIAQPGKHWGQRAMFALLLAESKS
jgi:hypothetical protein